MRTHTHTQCAHTHHLHGAYLLSELFLLLRPSLLLLLRFCLLLCQQALQASDLQQQAPTL